MVLQIMHHHYQLPKKKIKCSRCVISYMLIFIISILMKIEMCARVCVCINWTIVMIYIHSLYINRKVLPWNTYMIFHKVTTFTYKTFATEKNCSTISFTFAIHWFICTAFPFRTEFFLCQYSRALVCRS